MAPVPPFASAAAGPAASSSSLPARRLVLSETLALVAPVRIAALADVPLEERPRALGGDETLRQLGRHAVIGIDPLLLSARTVEPDYQLAGCGIVPDSGDLRRGHRAKGDRHLSPPHILDFET